jgi:hypothetical protein
MEETPAFTEVLMRRWLGVGFHECQCLLVDGIETDLERN